ncbi:hypothetical protein MtrunA17_Chr5g0439341 [Medicago truncatula]|uniref:Uncharacterized protein n=1 Tax=Medicago truncatula TaxID=3880 RepID=A0A396HZH7_MEDTR|nr:hypothetical protein MtrunA17_Chr5g0439341 [Medicago truncatula]
MVDIQLLLSSTVSQVLQVENVTENLRGFMDPNLRDKYPLDLTYSMDEIAKRCVDHDLNSRTNVSGGFHGYVHDSILNIVFEIHLTSLNGPYLLPKFLIADS